MLSKDVFIVHPSTSEQATALKAFIKAFKIKFEVTSDLESYNPEMVAKIEKSLEEFKEGKFNRVKKEDINQFLGL